VGAAAAGSQTRTSPPAMIVEASYIHEVYAAIKQDANSSEDQAVLCFASSTDVDSVCASQLLLVGFCPREHHSTLRGLCAISAGGQDQPDGPK
jgi:hypothetical protein